MPSPIAPSRVDVLRLAAAAQVDPRTAARAIREGADSVRVGLARDRVRRALAELGLTNPSPPTAA